MQALISNRPRCVATTITVATVVNSAIGIAAPSPPSPPSTAPLLAVAEAPPAPTLMPPEEPVAPAPVPPADRDERMERSRFSGKRLIVEMLAGAAIGSLVGYATFESLCDGKSDCLGPGLAGAAMNFGVTPLAVWGVGHWMGGQGTLAWTYLGASTALTPFSVPGSPNESPSDTISRLNIEFAISTLLLPVTSALFFELSSHVGYTRWRTAAQAGNLTVGITPTYDRRSVDGAMGHVTLSF